MCGTGKHNRNGRTIRLPFLIAIHSNCSQLSRSLPFSSHSHQPVNSSIPLTHTTDRYLSMLTPAHAVQVTGAPSQTRHTTRLTAPLARQTHARAPGHPRAHAVRSHGHTRLPFRIPRPLTIHQSHKLLTQILFLPIQTKLPTCP